MHSPFYLVDHSERTLDMERMGRFLVYFPCRLCYPERRYVDFCFMNGGIL